MERTENISLAAWSGARPIDRAGRSPRLFGGMLVASACLSAMLASWLPLQVSIATVFLFAGPHNWFELRYFLMRLPARFGRSRNFFAVAFAGIFVLTAAYLAMPALYYANLWSGSNWPDAIATWNTFLLLWLGALVIMRGKQNSRRDWRSLILLPLLIGGMLWQLSRTAALADDNGLFWRITQHAGADLLPNVSSHMLVSLHVFLEMLHYGVWIVALPLIGATGAAWKVRTIPLARRRGGFPRLIAAILIIGLFVVALLWFGFSVNYPAMRDIYFAVAIAHVLAEAPFLLRMI